MESKFPVHQILLKNDVLIIENICNLTQIDKKILKLIAIPLKLQGATGFPIRALAII